MNNHPIYILTIIRLNGEVIQEESNIAPSIKKSYITNNGLFINFEKVIETNEVTDRNFVRKYITCIERKPFDNNKIGVLQVKFINGNSYDNIGNKNSMSSCLKIDTLTKLLLLNTQWLMLQYITS